MVLKFCISKPPPFLEAVDLVLSVFGFDVNVTLSINNQLKIPSKRAQIFRLNLIKTV